MEYIPPGRRPVRQNPPTRMVEREAVITPKLNNRNLARRLIRGEGQSGKPVEIVVRTSKYFGSIVHDKDYIVPPQEIGEWDYAYTRKPSNWAAARVRKVTEGWLLEAYAYTSDTTKYDSRFGDGELASGGEGPKPINGVLTSEGLIYPSFEQNTATNGYSVYKTSLIHHRIGALANHAVLHSQLESYLGVPGC